MVKRSNGKRGVKAAERARHEGAKTYRRKSSAGGTGREEPSPSPSTIGDVEPGHHLCCIYETEEEHRAVLVPFLRHGLEGGQKVLYILDARDAETILGYLRQDGLDPEPYLERGQLSVLTAQDVYLKDGVFDPDAMIALLRSETDQALAEGYAALRVTSEMSWALRGLPGSERLIEYETKLNRFFPGSKCLAICQYDRRAFSAALLLDVLSTHPIAVIGTTVHDNLYYVPPAALLGPDPQAARLRVWMEHLSERKRRTEPLREADAELGLRAKAPSISTRDITVPDEIVRKWQGVVNVMAELIQVPAALIMKVEPPYIDVFSSSESSGNPFKPGARYDLAGVYCERVIQTKRELLVPNALKDKEWDSNPDLEYGMISYLGFPLLWPDGQVFGTICVSDTKENRYGEQHQRLILRFKELVESHLDQLHRSRQLEEVIAQREHSEKTLRQERRELEIRNRIEGIFLTVPDDEMYGEALTVILEAMASRYGVFGYLDDDGALVVPSMTRDIWDQCQVPDKDIVFPRETWGDSTWARAIRQKQTIFSNEPSTNVPEGHIPISRHIACPVIHQGEVVGITEVANKETDYDENDIWLLETISAAIAPVLSARLDRDRQEKERKRAEEALGERVKELGCLFDMSKLIETPDISLEQILQGTADLLPSSWRYPEVASARIVLGDQEFKTESFRQTPWRQASDIKLSGERIGSVEVCYLEERPESDEGPFLKEERGLIDAVAERLGRIVQRKRAEQERNHAYAKTEAIIRATPDMMFIVGGDGTYLDFIPAHGQEPLFPPGEFLGRTVFEVMPAELARKTMHLIEATLESGEMHRLEYELDTGDGKLQYEARYVVAGDDKVLAIVRDVTAQKRLEKREALRRARDELEGKVERDMLGKNPYGLTFREFTVLRLVTGGSADKEIGDQLGISTFTVNKHVANILAKMNASSRTEAGVRALREGLLT